MDSKEFSEEEWQEVFDEFRMLVVRAGYSDWDTSAMEALADETDEGDGRRYDRPSAIAPVEQLRHYAAAFRRFLKARSRAARSERLGQLGELLHTESGEPVQDFLVDFEGHDRAIFKGDDDPDGMIEMLGRFLDELDGKDGAFWTDGPGGDGDGT